MAAESCTLELTSKKNERKGMCINQHVNGEQMLCPIHMLGHRVLHLRQNSVPCETLLSSYFTNGVKNDFTNNDIRMAVKFGAKELDYPELRGIPINRVDTHFLRGGGAKAPSLVEYEDREIEKWEDVEVTHSIHTSVIDYPFSERH